MSPDGEFLPIWEVDQNIGDVSTAIQVFPFLGQKYINWGKLLAIACSLSYNEIKRSRYEFV